VFRWTSWKERERRGIILDAGLLEIAQPSSVNQMCCTATGAWWLLCLNRFGSQLCWTPTKLPGLLPRIVC
jgi:hypothetical protein